MTRPARGIRNNNPGNIDYNKANNWKGQLPHDPSI
ncbi:structural protein, partial [Providencia stuartii]